MHHVFAGRDTLLLDMDGTLLDLAYDNFFWQEHLPAAYADVHGLPADAAHAEVSRRITAQAGTLNWYCLDFWSRTLDLDILALKAECRDRIGFLAGAEAFLERARAQGFRLVLVTNSTRALLALKDAETGIARHMDALYSAHDFHAPKESQVFWQRFAQAERLDRHRCVFLDDSAAVLRAARTFGLDACIGLRRPDSRRPARALPDIPCVDRVAELLR